MHLLVKYKIKKEKNMHISPLSFKSTWFVPKSQYTDQSGDIIPDKLEKLNDYSDMLRANAIAGQTNAGFLIQVQDIDDNNIKRHFRSGRFTPEAPVKDSFTEVIAGNKYGWAPPATDETIA